LSSFVPLLGEAFRRVISAFDDFAPLRHPKIAGFLEYARTYAGAYLLRRGVFMPWELTDLMDGDFIREGLRRLDPLGHIKAAVDPEPLAAWSKVAALEACLYLRNQLLRDTDWASMAHSLEVRVPLVDATLLQILRRSRREPASLCWHILRASRCRARSWGAPRPASPRRSSSG
jgi:asparagine synthase (glutamine-hydrolysing)